jgi:Flp pilus assembly protein TadG
VSDRLSIGSRQSGQATVELALCLPVIAVLLAALLQVGVIVSDQTRLWDAAREAARVAVVDPNPQAITQAAERSGLAPVTTSIRPQAALRAQGRPLTITLAYRPRAVLPLLRGVVDGIELHAAATMRIEQP